MWDIGSLKLEEEFGGFLESNYSSGGVGIGSAK